MEALDAVKSGFGSLNLDAFLSVFNLADLMLAGTFLWCVWCVVCLV